jgi:hypothetical protein
MPRILLLVCLEIAFMQLSFLCNAFEIKNGPIQAASVQNKLIPVAITNQCKQVEAKSAMPMSRRQTPTSSYSVLLFSRDKIRFNIESMRGLKRWNLSSFTQWGLR